MQRRFVGTRLAPREFQMLRVLADKSFNGNLAACLRKLLNEPLMNPGSQDDSSYYGYAGTPEAQEKQQ